MIRSEIQKQIDKFEAIGGAGVLLDIKTGEMLAVASLPDFNPNQFSLANDDARFNRATKGLYEMGSTFKVLNTAIALESGAATTNQRFEVSKPLRVSRFTITDYQPHSKPLNVPEILVYSSNIGSALMAEAVGAKAQRAYMDKLGLLNRLELEIPEVSRPLSPKQWHRTTTVTVSMVMAFQFRQPILPARLPPHQEPANGFSHPSEAPESDTPYVCIFSEDTPRSSFNDALSCFACDDYWKMPKHAVIWLAANRHR